ncbi:MULTISPECIES: TNT domain-containing protein [unclassified Streptomyces]|uniref:TNT domain-containing protein n=1 Tax=unclassified Streptomyces TaxID=2593676 RepID=UPI00073BA9BF|nr:TNT domain-containing protein [Streptomyces sp. AVP053U2]ODA69348.1 hypothetical protein APS67_006496 [Streptomyces sp. AVP053U2]
MKNRSRAALSALSLAFAAALPPATATASTPAPPTPPAAEEYQRTEQAAPRPVARPAPCTGAYRGDARLGPKTLPRPWEAPVGPLLKDYRRTGDLSPDAFLATYWKEEDPEGPAGWKYPPNDGFAEVNGQVDKHVEVLEPGEDLDRFGSEYGSYLAPAGDPYAKRALPPQNLNTREPDHPCDYHRYTVTQPFAVWQGGVAPWFEQPGGGQQIKLDPALLAPGDGERLNVRWLLDHGYLVHATG